MFDRLIPLLIAIVLLIKILDYPDLLDIVATMMSLIVAAVAVTMRLTACLLRGWPTHRRRSRPSARLQLPIVSRVKHSGNTIVLFRIERTGRSRRLSCSTQGYCGGTRTETADVSKGYFNAPPHHAPAYCQALWILVEITTAIDDLASAFVTSLRVLRSLLRPRRGHGLFSTISIWKR
jgi:hypothetical protein